MTASGGGHKERCRVSSRTVAVALLVAEKRHHLDLLCLMMICVDFVVVWHPAFVQVLD